MGLSKTDFIRGCQCPKMLWLDRHHPEYKIIPPEVQSRLKAGNDFGDAMMGVFGPYTEIREYYAGTQRPNKVKMAAKTAEVISEGAPVICEAAFMDADKNYCAADILRRTEDGFYLYEVKNAAEVTDTFVLDAAYQTDLIRRCGTDVKKVFILYHAEEPFSLVEVTERVNALTETLGEKTKELRAAKEQKEELLIPMGERCEKPYECWYEGYCRMLLEGKLQKKRCSFVNEGHPLEVEFHDGEWGRRTEEDVLLTEYLLLCMFESGLKREIILRKRENFRAAFENFDAKKIAAFGEDKIASLLEDKGIIRHEKKIRASVRNAAVIWKTIEEYGSFSAYIDRFMTETGGGAEKLLKDLKKRGSDWLTPAVIAEFLKACGRAEAHEETCFLYGMRER